MTQKVISRKIKEPELPYLYISRQGINQALNTVFSQNKKCVYLSGITGYGKSVAVRNFLQNQSKQSRFWYSLDEWDKDPVTFLNYLYHIFLEQKLISEELRELFSQPLNTEKQIKNFIGFLSNDLESNLKDNTFLVLDNFQEVQNVEIIQSIIIFLLNYCPEKLKIILISQQNLPEIFFPYLLKQELEEIKFTELLLTYEEAELLLKQIGKSNLNLCQELLHISQKNISLFILLAQNFQDKVSLEKYYENKFFNSALNQITLQIYNSFSDEIKNFIHLILFLPKIKITILESIFIKDLSYNLNILKENGVLIFNQEENDYTCNPAFVPVLTEIFFDLPEQIKEGIVEKVVNLFSEDTPEVLISILFKAKVYKQVIKNIEDNYEYYFRNYLYSTLEHLILPLKEHFPGNIFLSYLQSRIFRSTGNLKKALNLIQSLDAADKTPEIILEEGICLTASGFTEAGINLLKKLESESNLKIPDFLSLINALGVSYLFNHQIDLALESFLKAIDLKNKITYPHDLLKIYHNLGLTYIWLGDFSQAISAYEQSIRLAREIKILPLGVTYNNLATIYNLMGEYNNAYQNCLEGLEIVEKINGNVERIQIYLTLSESYRGLKNVYKTHECLEYLEDLLSKNSSPILEAMLFKQKAYIALDENQSEKAKENILKAMHLRTMREGDSELLEYKLELAIINYYAGYYDESLNELNSIDESIKREKHKYHLARAYLYKALNYFQLKDSNNYEKYRELAVQIIKEKNYTLLAEKIDLNFEKPELHIFTREQPLQIFTFNQMEVKHNNKGVSKKDWRGKQTKLLLIYLLLNKKGVGKEQIYEVIFPEGDKSRSALHVLFSRLRNALGSIFEDTEIIQFSGDLYRFNFSIDYWWDAAQLEYLLNEARQQSSPEGKYKITEKALGLYKGHFMGGFELESWVFSTQEYYRRMAYNSFNELSDYYYQQKQFENLLELSGNFFQVDNCFENACKQKMKALTALNRKKDALQQYLILEHSLQKTLNDEPSKEMKHFKESMN